MANEQVSTGAMALHSAFKDISTDILEAYAEGNAHALNRAIQRLSVGIETAKRLATKHPEGA